MFIRKTARWIGRLWGVTFIRYVVLAYTRKRVAQFEIRTDGIENILPLRGKSYILVANHVLPHDLLLKIFAFPPLQRFNHSIDHFVLQQVVHEQTGRWIRVVAKLGRNQWHGQAQMRYLQQHIRQPLSQGQLEGVGYIAIDLKGGSFYKDFIQTVDEAISRQDALLIFPEGDVFEEFRADRSLQTGTAHLARKYDIPILPAYITGCDSWQPGQRVIVRFGPPLSMEGLSKPEMTEEIKRTILALKEMTHS